MKINIDLLQTDKFYHIYNRGINGVKIFSKPDHYQKFLKKYAHHLENIFETYAYCLLGNHFHFLVRVKSEEDIRKAFPYLAKTPISLLISKQIAHLFNGYAQYFNLKTDRTGALFSKNRFEGLW